MSCKTSPFRAVQKRFLLMYNFTNLKGLMQTVLARLKQKNKLNKKNILPFLEASLLCSGSLPLGETCHPQ